MDTVIRLLRWRPSARQVAVFCLLTLAACAPRSTDDGAPLESELVIRSLMAAREGADVDLLLDIFHPEATYDDFPNQTTYQGINEIVGYLTGVHDWGDDIYLNVGQVHAAPDGAVAEWVFSAIQSRPMGDLVPEGTGREVVLNGVTIVEIDGGRIRRAADYSDAVPMMLQLGGVIVLPSGDTLALGDVGG